MQDPTEQFVKIFLVNVKMNYLPSLICSHYFYFNCFLKSLPALQVDGSPFRGIGPENWACPSNQHKQSLKPLFQNPSWKGNESGKETGVTAAQRTHKLQNKEDFKLRRQKRINQSITRKHPRSDFNLYCSCPNIFSPTDMMRKNLPVHRAEFSISRIKQHYSTNIPTATWRKEGLREKCK